MVLQRHVVQTPCWRLIAARKVLPKPTEPRTSTAATGPCSFGSTYLPSENRLMFQIQRICRKIFQVSGIYFLQQVLRIDQLVLGNKDT
ncbi:hypothetical protein Mapa_003948 [Marchantia paleacea]|nr:hypothetical protein Mapa_003948 [Marchantia paleacea]